MMYRDAPNPPLQRQLCWLPVDSISPRESVHPPEGECSLDALTEDIRRWGLRRPILVRQEGCGYSVVSGNRRLLACRRAGMTHIDAVILPPPLHSRSAPQLLDALNGRCLHYLEEAELLRELNRTHGYTREALARIRGEDVQTIVNRMQLTALGEEVRVCLMEVGLPERAAMALLRLDDESQRLHVARKAARERLCIREVELLVSAAARRSAAEKPRSPGHGRVISLVRDPRLYINAIRRITEQMRSAGLAATMTEKREGGCVEVTVRLPVRRRRAARWADPDACQSI